jgi:hypothetical protein
LILLIDLDAVGMLVLYRICGAAAARRVPDGAVEPAAGQAAAPRGEAVQRLQVAGILLFYFFLVVVL